MTTAEKRFWKYVVKTENCWNWIGATAGPGRYGHFHVSGDQSDRVRAYAHRWSYEHLVGPIPDGLQIDHLCRNQRCVRPDHLEPVTHIENQARRRGFKTGPYDVGTHCKHGHERSPENTALTPEGWRVCRPCNREKAANSRRKRLSTTTQ